LSNVTIVGAGMMGSALCWPLADNHHSIRLAGTPLDQEIIQSIRETGLHPKLQRSLPEGVQTYTHAELDEALAGAEIVVSGVSSFGVDWFIQTAAPLLNPGIPVIGVTKGLVDKPDGSLEIIPRYIQARLPSEMRSQISLNAIAGPCIAHELAARRQTSVVFTGNDLPTLEGLRRVFATPYYHIWTSLDEVGVEVCAALKNAYALAVGLVVGMMETSEPDGLANMYNPQAAVFAQSIAEMRRWLEIAGGSAENIAWLPGPGDLYVTVFGGRTVRLGKLLGSGLSYVEARQLMAGETLESVEIITRISRLLPRLEQKGVAQSRDFPLMRHLIEIILHDKPVDLPWEQFFTQDGQG
jgi:glycerol-3-phosphate dehydrogenase (NAD(P)+)